MDVKLASSPFLSTPTITIAHPQAAGEFEGSSCTLLPISPQSSTRWISVKLTPQYAAQTRLRHRVPWSTRPSWRSWWIINKANDSQLLLNGKRLHRPTRSRKKLYTHCTHTQLGYFDLVPLRIPISEQTPGNTNNLVRGTARRLIYIHHCTSVKVQSGCSLLLEDRVGRTCCSSLFQTNSPVWRKGGRPLELDQQDKFPGISKKLLTLQLRLRTRSANVPITNAIRTRRR